MNVSVFGLGYVGCVTAACLAKAGHTVTAVDVNEDKVTAVNDGKATVIEALLDEVVSDAVALGRLRATVSVDEAMAASDVALICVGTPSGPNGRIDIGAVQRVGEDIGRALARRKGPYTIVLRSTVLPGTTENVLAPAVRAAAGRRAGIHIAMNPEFMREGTSVHDFHHPPLTLVGSDDPDAVSVVRELYQGIDAPFVHTAVKVAEMTKYVANLYHALKISFANEIGDIAQSFGADPQEVMRVFRMDRKLNISEAYLKPGFAFGGSCLPKDLRAILHAARVSEARLPLLFSVLPSNEQQLRHGIERVLETGRKRIGVVGLAFKPGTDDLRESPLVSLCEALIGKGCKVQVLDRNVSLSKLVGANRRYIEREIPHVASLLVDSPEALVEHAEVIVIGNASEAAKEVLARCRADQTIIDLTRGLVGPVVTQPSPSLVGL